MQLVIVDCGSGNVHSVVKSFRHVAEESSGHTVAVAQTPEALARADHIVLPGVGAFADCMKGLAAQPGLREALEEQVLKRGKPFLGICVGMQMLVEESHEHGTHQGLGWLPGKVEAIASLLPPERQSLRIPHMGWNELQLMQPDHPVLEDIRDGDHAYFVHSFAVQLEKPTAHLLASVGYGATLPAVIGRDNVIGTQFHPEKSQRTGLQLIENFLHWRP